MLSFREFYEICEGKKSGTPPNAVSGTYQERPDGSKSYTLAKPDEAPSKKPLSQKKLNKILDKQGGIGGGAIKKELKKKKKM